MILIIHHPLNHHRFKSKLTYSMKKLNIYTLFAFLVFVDLEEINAQNADLFINPNNPVNLSDYKQINGIHDLVKISFPDAVVRFMYSSGDVDFCVFDLKTKNSFLVFSSTPHALLIGLKIDNIDSDSMEKMLVKYTERSSQKVHSRFFGHYFQLKEGQSFEILGKGEYNEGNLKFNITKDAENLLLGSVSKEN